MPLGHLPSKVNIDCLIHLVMWEMGSLIVHLTLDERVWFLPPR